MPSRPHRQHGAILIESLVALTLLSLCAAGTLAALDRMDTTSQSLRQLSAEIREQNTRTETADLR
ncbi:hypothetical protein [Ralstonia sp. A12]|uniref:hypothetical protein n=1 Tax=Ralstonia sp. A12 TaxID=1217052 RepID=UPI00057E06F9|nr:hypothetical protein [Ralstonia sp. A12]